MKLKMNGFDRVWSKVSIDDETESENQIELEKYKTRQKKESVM